ILIRRSRMVANLPLASGFALGIEARTPCISQNAAVWSMIGGRAVTGHAIGRQLRLVQLDQVLHLPALAIDVLIKMLRRALERSDDVTDVDLLAHAGLSPDRLQ